MKTTSPPFGQTLSARHLGGFPARDADPGAYLTELAVTLPFFIVLIFATIDLARMASGYSAVRAAAAQSARWAAGSDRPEWQPINAMFGGSPNPVPVAVLKGYPGFYFKKGTDGSWYDNRPPNDPIQTLYEPEVRAIAYANQVIRRTIGDSKYPCQDQAGCFACFTMRRDPLYIQAFALPSNQTVFVVPMLGMQCRYDVPITATSVTFGWLPRYITVHATAYASLENYATLYYDPS